MHYRSFINRIKVESATLGATITSQTRWSHALAGTLAATSAFILIGLLPTSQSDYSSVSYHTQNPPYKHTTENGALAALLRASQRTKVSADPGAKGAPSPLWRAHPSPTSGDSSFAEISRWLQPLQEISKPPRIPRKSAAGPGRWHEVTVQRGDSLGSIFGHLDIYAEVARVMALDAAAQALRTIHPGDILEIRTLGLGRTHDHAPASKLEELVYDLNDHERLRIVRDHQGLRAQRLNRQRKVREAMASGEINHSLFKAGKKAGLSTALTMRMAEIFGWDIDFALDIRQGDHFSVIYNEYYRDGEKLGDGDILAAEFSNRGHIFRAFRYTDAAGQTDYYAPDGKSMRKPFKRTPVSIARISSRFNPHRRHPLLDTTRPHEGVDYAAPRGTPIKATGDGKVIFRGTKGGYGRTVILRHGNIYTTLYGHMSRYARHARVGDRVHQGQTIGYIGSSGLATGPHVHYEFRVHGVHRNPLTVKLPAADSLADGQLAAFKASIKPQLAQLEHADDDNQVALNSPPTDP